MENGIKNSNNVCKMEFVKLTENAKTPVRGSLYAAGYDLFSAETKIIPSQDRCLVMSDIAVKVPAGAYGRIAPRSGLALKEFVDVGGGVVDGDYSGNIGIILFNHGINPFLVTKGDRIAQLIIEKVLQPELIEVKQIEKSARGQNGFGSTGMK